MNFEEVQPFLRLGSILQWLVIVLVFLAGFLQIAKFLLDKKVETMREEIASSKVAEYEKRIGDLQAKAVAILAYVLLIFKTQSIFGSPTSRTRRAR